MASLFTCEHPVRVFNKYLGEYMSVPCRKCAMCKSARASRWTQKLNNEAKCHPYVFFGTLTYAPEFLPYLDVDWTNGFLYNERGAFYSLKDLNLDYDSIEFIRSRKCLPVFDVPAVQKFIKRVRERIRVNKSGEPRKNRYLRYYVVAEYGETLLRPHYHFIFYTGSKWFAENAKSIVSQCWSYDYRSKSARPLGRVDCQAVINSASSYVASYLTCDDNLPKVYTLRQFRPTALFSRSPALGALQGYDEEVRELFDRRSVTRPLRYRKTNEVVDVLLEKSLSDRLYPRIGGFGQMAFDELNSIYALADKARTQSFSSFFFWTKSLSERGNLIQRDYFSKIHSRNDYSEKSMPLRYLFGVLRRFSFQRQLYGISVRDYVERIQDYYSQRDMYLLNFQCKWQETISKDKALRDYSWLLVDPVFLSQYLTKSPHSYEVTKFGDSAPSVESIQDFTQLNDFEFQSKLHLSKKVISDGKNRHLKYEYLMKADIDNELKGFLIYFINKKLNDGCK